jgi:MOSC domain-containing protein YiiM
MAIPAHLMRTWAHQDFGIYAKVVVGGSVAIGAPVNQTPIPSI